MFLQINWKRNSQKERTEILAPAQNVAVNGLNTWVVHAAGEKSFIAMDAENQWKIVPVKSIDMPKLEYTYTLDINLERFIAACSDNELYELYILLDSEVLRRERKQEMKVKNSKKLNP